MGIKVRKLRQTSPDDMQFAIFCPACGHAHAWKCTGRSPRWSWNNNAEKPTVWPSINASSTDAAHRCHFTITDGKIKFQPDCFHSLKNMEVDLPDFGDGHV